MSTATQTPAATKPARRKSNGDKAPKAAATKPKAPKAVKPEGVHPHQRSTDALRDAAKRYEHDKANKTAGGHTSVNNGDEVAKMLLGKDLEAVYKLAAETLGETQKDLKAKYEHLNPGMQRMNLGNRMRAVISPKK